MPQGRFIALRSAEPGVSAVAAQSRHAFARHTHDQYGVGLMTRGAQRSASGRGPVQARAGELITVNPGEVHDGAPLGEGERAWCMLYFEPALIAQAAAGLDGDAGSYEFHLPVLGHAALAAAFARLYACVTTPGAAPLARDAALLQLLAGLRRPDPGRAPARLPHPGIARARQRIDDDPAAALTLADLAQACGLSRYQVLRGFAHATGLPPHAYQTQRRLQLARRLILQGVPLAETAAACGFADQSHLSRLFARSYGMTSGRYARAAR